MLKREWSLKLTNTTQKSLEPHGNILVGKHSLEKKKCSVSSKTNRTTFHSMAAEMPLAGANQRNTSVPTSY